jgi:pSer/pThr/pTyr-binding forkhead associated (FHA) protein
VIAKKLDTSIHQPMLNIRDNEMIVHLKSQDIERRLSLYQVFVSLYERHRDLLNDILQLDNLSHLSRSATKSYHLQGVINGSDIYITTNLCDNQTQTLQQPQHIWTIGRDRSNGICIDDQLLSLHHAAIQYVEDEGFFLIDCSSENGSFVNSEPVYQPVCLKDGDRIRLGSLSFDFFLNHNCRDLPKISQEQLNSLLNQQDNELSYNPDHTVKLPINYDYKINPDSDNLHLNQEQKSEILDLFFQGRR